MVKKGFPTAFAAVVAAMGVATAVMGACAPAQAAERSWTATGCGDEPAAPSVDVSSVERYNASVDKVSAYEKLARAYNACVSKAAVKEETAISNDARDRIAYVHEGSSGVQQRISTNFTQLTSALRAGGAKLQKAPH